MISNQIFNGIIVSPVLHGMEAVPGWFMRAIVHSKRIMVFFRSYGSSVEQGEVRCIVDFDATRDKLILYPRCIKIINGDTGSARVEYVRKTKSQ